MKQFVSKLMVASCLLAPVVTAHRASAVGVITTPVGPGVIAGGVILIVAGLTGAAELVGAGVGGLAGGIIGGVGGGLVGACAGEPVAGAATGASALGVGFAYLGAVAAGCAAIAVGILLLEDENGKADFQFAAIETEAAAAERGLSHDEFVAYNNSIEELNGLKSQVKEKLVELSKTREVTEKDSAGAWLEVKDELEGLGISFSTLSKIMAPKAA